MLIGILCALGAGLAWGMVFIVPLLLADYPGTVLSLGRYLAYGAISLVPALLARREVAALTRADWLTALKLSLVGNLFYYAALASAIQLADAPLPTMIIGTLPVVISVYSNWQPGAGGRSVPWGRLVLPLAVILAGLLLVNGSELAAMRAAPRPTRSIGDYALGCAITVCAVAAWTWYPVMNARYLRGRPSIRASTWATAQGLAILPVTLAGIALYGLVNAASTGSYRFPLGSQPSLFVAVMLATGLLASWVGTLLWNQASARVPTSLAGQLIVFETLAALAYAFIWRGSAPPDAVLAGAVCLCVGVLFGIRAFSAPPAAAPSTTS